MVGDVLNAPFDDGTFDTIIATQVAEHVEKPWIMVKEIKRILKPNGVCILTAPFMIPSHNDPTDFFRFTKDGTISLFKNEGFEIIECDYYGKIFSVLAEMIHFVFLKPYEKPGVWSQRFLRYLEKFASKLDRFARNEIVYANVYIIAKKI